MGNNSSKKTEKSPAPSPVVLNIQVQRQCVPVMSGSVSRGHTSNPAERCTVDVINTEPPPSYEPSLQDSRGRSSFSASAPPLCDVTERGMGTKEVYSSVPHHFRESSSQVDTTGIQSSSNSLYPQLWTPLGYVDGKQQTEEKTNDTNRYFTQSSQFISHNHMPWMERLPSYDDSQQFARNQSRLPACASRPVNVKSEVGAREVNSSIHRSFPIESIRTSNIVDKKEKPSYKGRKSLQGKKLVMSTTHLLELSGKERNCIIDELKSNKDVFAKTISGPISDLQLQVLMKIAKTVSTANSNEKIEVLDVFCCENFINALGVYISNLPTHQKEFARENCFFLVETVLPFCETLLMIPHLISSLRSVLIKTSLALHGIEKYQNLNIADEEKMRLKNLLSTTEINLHPEKGEQNVGASSENKCLKPVKAPETRRKFECRKYCGTEEILDVMAMKSPDSCKVRGMCRDIFFVNSETCEDFASRGKFLFTLALYLLKQKYQANDIVILTTDESNRQKMMQLRDKQFALKNMNVELINDGKVLDAVIILIAFPLGNATNTVEKICKKDILHRTFLGAKEGIYMTGNMAIMEQYSPWTEINQALQQHKSISSHLPLRCESHHNVTLVAEAEDFRMLENGGCTKRCLQNLQCGHICKRMCHSDDREHKKYFCREPCIRRPDQCSMNHTCTKLCHETCGECSVTITINNKQVKCHERSSTGKDLKKRVATKQKEFDDALLLTKSSHIQKKSELHFRAAYPDNTRPIKDADCRPRGLLSCGHADETITSAHPVSLGSDERVNLCQVPCSSTLSCGHICSGTCGMCRQGKVHVTCMQKKKVTLSCGHRMMSPCNVPVSECNQKCFYECSHMKCKERCGEPCTPCKERCSLGCKHALCTRKCYELCDRLPCHKPCDKYLPCGHYCIGFCGEPCPQLCRICDGATLRKWDSTGNQRFVLLNDCNHIVRANGLDQKVYNKSHKVEGLVCPVCGYNIIKTSRYLNYAKELRRDLVMIKNACYTYNNKIQEEFFNVNKEFQSCILPKEIVFHPKLQEVKEQLKATTKHNTIDLKMLLLLVFVRNILRSHSSTHVFHFDWILSLVVERFKTNVSSQVLNELYKELFDYQKLARGVHVTHLLELHKAIAFSHLMEKNTWIKCKNNHLSSTNSLVSNCSLCDGMKLGQN